MQTTDISGGLNLELVTRGDRISEARLTSARPTGLGRFFRGKPPAVLVERLPLIFSLCGTAQAVAACQAMEQGLHVETAPARVACRRAAVLAETLVETLRGMVVEWAAYLDRPLDPAPLAAATAARQRLLAAYAPANAWRRVAEPGGVDVDLPTAEAAIAAMAEALSAVGIDEAIGAVRDLDGLAAWAGGGDELARQTVCRVLEDGTAGFGHSPFRPLRAPLDDLGTRLAADGDGGFQAQPTIAGETFETGALGRVAEQPLIRALRDGHGSGLITRLAARIVEAGALTTAIAALVAAPETAADAPITSAFSPAPGQGVGAVDCARGQLLHWVRMDDGAVGDYRILAPTKWTFHPRGALIAGLEGAAVGSDVELERTVRLMVAAMDPCVACHVSLA